MRTELHKSKRRVRDQEQQIGQITRDAQQLARDLEAQIDQLRAENEAHRRQRKGRQTDDQARDLQTKLEAEKLKAQAATERVALLEQEVGLQG